MNKAILITDNHYKRLDYIKLVIEQLLKLEDKQNE